MDGGDGEAERADPHDLQRELSYREKVQALRERHRHTAEIAQRVDDYEARQQFIIRLAKALLRFGAPSHRIESQLSCAGTALAVNVAFVHLPSVVIVNFLDTDTRTSDTHFVRAGGRVALSKLHRVRLVYRAVLHDELSAAHGLQQLDAIMAQPPEYAVWVRCVFAFFCASIISALAFGGSIADMFVAGGCASVLQWLGLKAAAKSTIYANVYEITVSIVVSFVARALSSLPGNLFCYSAIASGGVVLILPGFTILIAALELTSKNILCGSVRMVHAVIYTLFLGFGLTMGSDLYLLFNPLARRNIAASKSLDAQVLHGAILDANTSQPLQDAFGTFTFFRDGDSPGSQFIKGSLLPRPDLAWWRQTLPWWAMFVLVPVYSTCSSLCNLQALRSVQLPVMVLFSCLAFAANRLAQRFVSDRGDIVSATGAFVIGLCGNAYSRLFGGTAFTSMVTGVLFLSAIGTSGGLTGSNEFVSSSQRNTSSFELGIRMIQVAIGVTIGMLVAQVLVYSLAGKRKNGAHFAF
ncbi:DUF1212-domain-containing protein [Epithele typhae]|uniref:DUF1212-domain-containing protein n=1 Tax=Epithele typhae TaxID=378194 RepID=UPI002007FC7F|nr:DUF1212-domain-containing protein [Epithele typhae]KAH9944199.1 DUF1212-domain-containing protein [Epithele typhae]